MIPRRLLLSKAYSARFILFLRRFMYTRLEKAAIAFKLYFGIENSWK